MPLAPVFKFGGTSMGSVERIKHVAKICETQMPSVVVVSAMSGETNRLVCLASEFSSRIDVPEYDLLVASGEQVSVSLLCMAMRQLGLKPWPMLGLHAGILTNDQFSKAMIHAIDRHRILDCIDKGFTPVVAGFQGVTLSNQVTSLGRGGSDTSAVALAAGIQSPTCVIYTDVDGVFSADPRICPTARILRRIHSDEMLEMASQGSKVLHIRSVHLAAKWGVKLIVKNTFSQDEGTEVVTEHDSIEGEIVSGVASSTNEAWVTMESTNGNRINMGAVFGILAGAGINVDIITQGKECTVLNFTIPRSDGAAASAILHQKFSELSCTVRNDVAKVSIVGIGMRTHPGVAARMFQSLDAIGIDILLVTTSEIKLACLIHEKQEHAAVRALHAEFVEKK